MLIGVISDTHGYYDSQIDARFAGVDLIIHAGDIGGEPVRSALARIAPVVAVRGNADVGQLGRLPLIQTVEAEDARLLVTHIAGLPERMSREVRRAYEQMRPDAVIFGHSHQIQAAIADGGTLFFNPGAAGKQGFHTVRSIGLLEVHGRAITARHIELHPRYATRTGD
ncbi:MAG: metallophosphoesterase family protein [Chloroflexi bacterium]|nr:metallophosphoesterase family protein [Chloroflexota bacterium]